jgi:glycosyltransferase involved in cell wall biosynthesis
MNLDRIATIVVPLYNNEDDSPCLLKNLQEIIDASGNSVEAIVVDDCSTDGSLSFWRNELGGHEPIKNKNCFYYGSKKSISLYQTNKNQGPGAARNVGIQAATGEYISFLDSDDLLIPENYLGLLEFAQSCNPETVQGVAFNFAHSSSTDEHQTKLVAARKDMHSAAAPVSVRQRKYLGMGMDGSVIFTLFRRLFLTKNKLQFRSGLHEDIDFMWRFYAAPIEIEPFNKIIYIKKSKQTSIVHNISRKHILGYISAVTAIVDSVMKPGHVQLANGLAESINWLRSGCTGFISVLIRQIHKLAPKELQQELYDYLYKCVAGGILTRLDEKDLPVETMRDIMTNKFLQYYNTQNQKKSADDFIFGEAR